MPRATQTSIYGKGQICVSQLCVTAFEAESNNPLTKWKFYYAQVVCFLDRTQIKEKKKEKRIIRRSERRDTRDDESSSAECSLYATCVESYLAFRNRCFPFNYFSFPMCRCEQRG